MKDLVIFDGDCGICTKSSQIIQKWDKKKLLDVQAYQFLDLPKIDPDLDAEKCSQSVYFKTEDNLYKEARAIFEICKKLPGIIKIPGYLFSNKFFEVLFRPVYRLIAKNRTKISQALGLAACKVNFN